MMEEKNRNLVSNTENAPEEPKQKIRLSAIRIAVFLYILWIAGETAKGLLMGDAKDASPVLLGVVVACMLAAAVYLIVIEIREQKKKNKDKETK